MLAGRPLLVGWFCSCLCWCHSFAYSRSAGDAHMCRQQVSESYLSITIKCLHIFGATWSPFGGPGGGPWGVFGCSCVFGDCSGGPWGVRVGFGGSFSGPRGFPKHSIIRFLMMECFGGVLGGSRGSNWSRLVEQVCSKPRRSSCVLPLSTPPPI